MTIEFVFIFCLFVWLSVWLATGWLVLSFSLSICLSLYLSIYLSVCVCVCVSVWVCVYLSLSLSLSLYRSLCLCVCARARVCVCVCAYFHAHHTCWKNDEQNVLQTQRSLFWLSKTWITQIAVMLATAPFLVTALSWINNTIGILNSHYYALAPTSRWSTRCHIS